VHYSSSVVVLNTLFAATPILQRMIYDITILTFTMILCLRIIFDVVYVYNSQLGPLLERIISRQSERAIWQMNAQMEIFAGFQHLFGLLSYVTLSAAVASSVLHHVINGNGAYGVHMCGIIVPIVIS
jgi:hypothetical protein